MILKVNIILTVFYGLSTFVIVTNCCSSHVTKLLDWDYISCNDCVINIINESISPDYDEISSKIKFGSINNNNYTLNSSSKDIQYKMKESKIVVTPTNPDSNIHGTNCPKPIDETFCSNGGHCRHFIINGDSIYSCECPDGYYGETCEFKYIIHDNYNSDDTDGKTIETIKILTSSTLTNCPPEFDENFCLNGGKCFKYTIGDAYIMSCLCSDGYFGERCDFKYVIRSDSEEKTFQHNHYHHQHYHNGQVIRKAKIYLSPFIIGLLISILLYVTVCSIFLDSGQGWKIKFHFHRAKHKLFKIKYFFYIFIRRN